MLGTRLVSGVTMAAVLVAILYADEWMAPWFPLWLILTLTVMGLASLELIGLLHDSSARPSRGVLFGGVLAVVLSNWAPHVLGADQDPSYDALGPVSALGWTLMAFTAVAMLCFFAESLQYEKPGATMATIAGTLLGVTYLGLFSAFVIQLRWFDGPYHGLLPVGFLFATAKGSDVGAYSIGRIAGRHKLWPKLSPNKTIEGSVGGLIVGVAGSLGVAALAREVLGVPTLSWPSAIGFGLVVGASAQLGDLMESMIKRDCERKDASDTVPGFGGVLDVIDSPLFAGPVAFGFWLLFGP
ncbi:MAG: phosphatidate cytidylyltransferase [Isosphaeraceae bacterium]